MAAVLKAAADGELTPIEAGEVAKAVGLVNYLFCRCRCREVTLELPFSSLKFRGG
jgi:hypothetical protein